MVLTILGIDPGLRTTGWGVIAVEGNRLSHVADGIIDVPAKGSLAQRLAQLFAGVEAVIERYAPDEAAVEEIFVNRNPVSTLKLGQARGVTLLAPARAGLDVYEYSTNLVKKSVVGAGHADKIQVMMMIRTLLPGASLKKADAADALAVAVCHAHHRASRMRWGEAAQAAGAPR
jgi:crossover junction endodeoxyribonuclease RuvC